MQSYQKAFLRFAIVQGALSFGSFRLKSGRVSPYFFNAGRFCDGASLLQLGESYAKSLQDSTLDYDMLFGAAYKGIPLVSATAMILSQQSGKNLPYAFNRKEKKDHGEGGMLVGADMQGKKVIVIDDVITAGTAIGEVMPILEDAGARVTGVLIALDRQEKGNTEQSAIDEVSQTYSIPVLSIVKVEQILAFIQADPELSLYTKEIEVYQDQYGVR